VSKLLKQYLHSELEQMLEGKDGAVVVHYQGLNSQEEYDFRKALREKDVRMRVVKASLARVYCRDHEYTGDIEGVFAGPVALVISQQEEGTVSAAREMLDLVKSQKKVKIQGAIFDGEVIAKDQVEPLSKTPTKAQLLAQLAGVIKAPTEKLAQTLYQVTAEFAGVVNALQSKREKDEG